MKSFVRIFALVGADILVGYALFVMQIYLTDVWKLSFTHAAGILNVWNGIYLVLPVFFLFLVDQFLGNSKMLLISSIAYSVGIGFVTMSTPPVLADYTDTCKEYEPQCIGHTQKVFFYTGMALVAVGMAGNLVSVKPFLEAQEDKSINNFPKEQEDKSIIVFPRAQEDKSINNFPKEQEVKSINNKGMRNCLQIPSIKEEIIKCLQKPSINKEKMRNCLQIPGFIIVVLTPVIGVIALPYIRPWTLRFGIPAICTVIATLLFQSGYPDYDKVKPEGSPITNVCRVFVAFAFKISRTFPLHSNQLYRKDDEKVQSLRPTRFLRSLEKAAIICPDTNLEAQLNNKWRLCSIEEVEEAKVVVRMIPVWLTFIVCGIVSSIGNTYFVEQAKNMNRGLGKWNVPLQVFLLLSGWARVFFSALAAQIVKISQKYGPPLGIAVAMVFSILCCITAARIEKRRIDVIRNHGLLNNPDDDIPMSVYWLLFQFFLLVGLDSFFEQSVAAFYNYQAPESMRNYLRCFTRGVSGLGYMFSVLAVYVVGKVSENGGRRSWFQHTLNRSRLDRYYWVLAALSSANLVVFVIVASCYQYKNREYDEDNEDFV